MPDDLQDACADREREIQLDEAAVTAEILRTEALDRRSGAEVTQTTSGDDRGA